jgi:hypothetical protein
MSFQNLPVEVQVVAARVLGEMITSPERQKEPVELAQEVMGAFKALSGSRVEELMLLQTARINDLISLLELYFPKSSGGNGEESAVV